MATINTVSNNSTASAAAAVSSPRHAGDSVSSPQSRRASRAGTPPWTQIVRGESEPIAAVPSSPSATSSMSVAEPVVAAVSSSSSASSSPSPVEESVAESSENGCGPNGNAGKRPAWNKPSNGVAEVGPVMGAVSWPPLSESTKASSKSSPESSKGALDGSSFVSVSQGIGTTTTSLQKQPNPTSTPNHTAPTRQRSMKRNNTNAPSNGGNLQQQPSASQVVEMPPNNPSPKDNAHRSGFGSHNHGGGDHPQPRNSFRGRNSGSHPRGDGSHHHNYGSRRDQDRGNHDWNGPRNFNGRDTHMQPQRVVSRFRGPAPPVSSTPFIHPPPVRPYGSPIGFGELQSHMVYVAPHPESLRMPFMAPIGSLYFAAPDPQLHSKIVNQIDYYFSNENLIKDTYLRQRMDDQGWVPIKTIASFNKVMHLTDDIQLILEAVRISNVLEVQGDKVRRRNDWMRWVMPPSVRFPNVPSPRTPGKSGYDMLAGHVQRIALEEKSNNSHSHSSVQNNSSHPQLSDGEGTGQFSVQTGADCSISARN